MTKKIFILAILTLFSVNMSGVKPGKHSDDYQKYAAYLNYQEFFEDFSVDNGEWTKYDPEELNKIELDYIYDNRLEFNDWKRYEPGYVYRPFPATDFVLEYDINITGDGGNANLIGPGFSDTLGTKKIIQNGVFAVYYAGFGGPQIDIQTFVNGSVEWDCGGWGDLPNRIWVNTNTTYYVRFEKSGDILTLSIFSDAERTQHIAGSPKAVNTNLSAVTFNYFYAVNGPHADNPQANWEWTSGWIDNIYVKGQIPPTNTQEIFEDFSVCNSNWLEYDPENKIEIDCTSDHRLEMNHWIRYEPGYVYRSWSTQDFILEYDINITDHGGNGNVVGPGFSDTLDTMNTTQNGAFAVYYAGFGGPQIDIATFVNGIVEWSWGGWGDQPNRIWINTNTTYYIRFEKSGETLKLSIFSDASRTTHITGSPKTVTTSLVNTTFNYFYAVNGYHTSPQGNWEWTSGWIDNIYVKGQIPPTNPQEIFEDFSACNSDWLEYDPENKIEIDCTNDHRLELNHWIRYDPAYVYRPWSTQDFLLEYDINITDDGGNANMIGPGFSDTLGGIWTTQNGAHAVYYAGFGGPQIDIATFVNGIVEWNIGGWGDLPNRIWINTNTTYYVRFEKSENTLKLSIFSDSGRTTHIPGSPKTVTTSLSSSTFNYFYAVNGPHANPQDNWEWTSGWIDNIYVRKQQIPGGDTPEISLNRTSLTFGALSNGVATSSQHICISNTQNGTLNWTSFSSESWLQVYPGSGTGGGEIVISVNPIGLSPSTYTGTITISDPNAINSPQTVTAALNVYNADSSWEPFGEFATPIDNSSVMSSIPVTGWVLDDIGVDSVKIYRGEVSNLVYIGDAVFVDGARPDVEQAYPGYPLNYQAGWGYMMLTNFLPNGGNGTFKIHAIAADTEGHQVTLGTKTITCDNANAVKPFGAIDTPGQGGTASGSSFINWGWVLTPQPNHIPTNGSTINVYVDGVNLGHPTYNIYREDIAALFPDYTNSDGAAGYFSLDTTQYENGVHTIQWTAADDAGNTDGIGSRYFTIRNSSSGYKAIKRGQGGLPPCLDSSTYPNLPPYMPENVQRDYPIEVIKGYNTNLHHQKIYPDENSPITLEIKELEPLEIHFNTPNWSGFQFNGNQLKSLPIGSTLDTSKGIFYWLPGPGFIGEYDLFFFKTNALRQKIKQIIRIVIKPKFIK